MKPITIGVAAISLAINVAWGTASAQAPTVVAARREGPLSVKMGSWRRARLRQSYQAGFSNEGRPAH
jgi:hypothetical protein